MEQIKAMNALEPFLALSKSASSPRAAADLIIRATSAPNTFIFAELLSTPQIQSLSSSEEYKSHLSLLQIFSYGTYADYQSTSNLPKLNEAQTLKLRQLSILTLATDPSNLSYASLISSLGLDNARELEDLVISSIYAGLITGTLDPYHQLVHLTSISALRDLPPNSIPAMLSTLHAWSARCVSTLADLEKQISDIKFVAQRRQKEEREWNAHVEKLMEIKETPQNGSGNGAKEEKSSKLAGFGAGLGRILGTGAASKRGSGGLDENDMDLDNFADSDEEQTPPTRSAKRRGGFGGLGFGKS